MADKMIELNTGTEMSAVGNIPAVQLGLGQKDDLR